MELSIPQTHITPKSKMKLSYDSPSSCFFVIVGGKYLSKIGDVLEKVDSVRDDLGGIRPLAVFLMNNNIKENVHIDVDYGFERFKYSPAMVNNLIDIFIWNILLFYSFKWTPSVLD